jgi:acetyl-CoA carboxylase carboxyl transferase subunit beta
VRDTDQGVGSPRARTAIDAVTEEFEELSDLDDIDAGHNPIGWPDYPAVLARARQRSGEEESVVCGRALVGGVPAVVVAFDFRFVGGSIGRRSGDRIVRAISTARRERRPLVSLLASGGSRMHEGMVALHQLPRIAAELARVRRAGIPHIGVARDPTTGGVWATLGASADVTLAVAGAQVGFAGLRVRSEGEHVAFTAEGQHAAGNIDAALPAGEIPGALAAWLRLLRPRPHGAPAPEPPPAGLGSPAAPADGWSAVRAARSPDRPRALAYLQANLTDVATIHGDRCGGHDPGLHCGFGRSGDRTVAFAAQTGTATTPAGYRTATRLIRLAERFGTPVLTLIDTPGAAALADAEATGLAPAIAELFMAVAEANVPITTLVIGEGGSGGALALASPAATWLTGDAYFAVIAPELAAAILKRDRTDAPAVADLLRLRPEDLVALGLARGIRHPAP